MLGKPLKYKTPAEMQDAIDAYFEACEGEILLDDNGKTVVNKYGEPIYLNQRPPTITGLALALGFASRQALINYQCRKSYYDTVARAKARCEEYAERRLYDRDGSRGAEFSLRYNFKWAEPDAEDTMSAIHALVKSNEEAAKRALQQETS